MVRIYTFIFIFIFIFILSNIFNIIFKLIPCYSAATTMDRITSMFANIMKNIGKYWQPALGGLVGLIAIQVSRHSSLPTLSPPSPHPLPTLSPPSPHPPPTLPSFFDFGSYWIQRWERGYGEDLECRSNIQWSVSWGCKDWRGYKKINSRA